MVNNGFMPTSQRRIQLLRIAASMHRTGKGDGDGRPSAADLIEYARTLDNWVQNGDRGLRRPDVDVNDVPAHFETL